MTGSSDRTDLLRRVLGRKALLVGGCLTLLICLTAVLAPLLAPYPYDAQNLDRTLEPPSREHLFGTDDFGRDFFSRILHGARSSLSVGIIAVGVGGTIGITLGAIAGYFRGWLDHLIMAGVDVVWSFPTLLVAIALVAVLRPGLTSAMIAVGLATWPSYARVARGMVISIDHRDFVQAARAVGASPMRVLLRHIMPSAWPPLVVMATLGIADAILFESTLSYLGLGAQPPIPSWGTMLADGRAYMGEAPWVILIPGIAVLITVLGFNLLGDALRDLLDPRTKR